jgi:hypothetical protein
MTLKNQVCLIQRIFYCCFSCFVVATSLATMSLAGECATPAATDTFTEMGTWSSGDIPFKYPAGGYICREVKFPTPFGGVPTVFITGAATPTGLGKLPTSFNHGIEVPAVMAIQDLTPDGFKPVTRVGGLNVVSGTWIAVGPVPHAPAKLKSGK